MRNLLCLLPDGHIPVQIWGPDACGGWYVIQADCYGPGGRVGYWIDKPIDTYALQSVLKPLQNEAL